jgi:menaquinol-cytochrome c reductase iron-sulfur subunit
MTDSASPKDTDSARTDDRRSFFAVVTALVAGAVAMLTPLAAGVATFCTPLFRRQKNQRVRIALLSQVPDDGKPRYFPVSIDRQDAWNRYPQQRVGAVYLIRQSGAAEPMALTAKCPHAGCFVGYTPGDDQFKCPCHTSAFKLDGSRVHGDAEVSPRAMDKLPVELREINGADGASATEVWVEFIDFQTGHSEQIRSA